MRLLWMKSDYIFPPDTGGKIRSYNLLRELNQLCEVVYLSFATSSNSSEAPEARQCAREVLTVHRPEEDKAGLPFYGRVLRGLASRLPYALKRNRSERIMEIQRRLWQESRSQPFVILCDFLQMAENVPWDLPCPKVLFQHNVESLIWQRHYENEENPIKRAYLDLERRRMRRYEVEACNRFDLVFTVSEKDKSMLRDEMGVSRPIEVLETGVDTRYFVPDPDVEPVSGKLVFLGSMDWMPNIEGLRWFVREVYPRLKEERPEVSLDIVGRRPVREVRLLAESDRSIRVTGDVPDVRPHIAAADVFVVPLRVGGGTRIKIYEAMAMARAVVSTTIGAEGLPVEPGRHILIGDTPDEFSRQVIRLMEDQDLKEEIGASGHRFVTEHCGWEGVARRLYDRCLELTRTCDREARN